AASWEAPMPTDTLTAPPARPEAAPRRTRTASLHRRRTMGNAMILAFLVVASLVMAAPFLWMALSAVRDPSELAKVPMPLIPREWRWENFSDALSQAPFAIYAPQRRPE